MDPHAILRKQRELARHIITLQESIPDDFDLSPEAFAQRDENAADIRETIADAAEELACLMLALDDWRLSGGFDPYARTKART